MTQGRDGQAASGMSGLSPPHLSPGTQSSSPFGWTGIKRERYTRWNGQFDGRQKITLRMVKEGVRFNIKTWPVIILLVLAWMFTVFLPVLFGAMGGMPLESENPSNWNGLHTTQARMHGTTTNLSAAEYPLPGVPFTNQTRFDYINMPDEWKAFVNASGGDQGARASLFVIPPQDAPPGTSEMVQLYATTGMRVDHFSALTTIAPSDIPALTNHSYAVDFLDDHISGRAGGKVSVKFNITNTGALPDECSITVRSPAKGWGVSAYVNGSKVPVKTLPAEPLNEDVPPEFTVFLRVSQIQLNLGPGERALCEVRFSTTTDSAKLTSCSLTIDSLQDRFITERHDFGVRLSDTQRMDRTSDVLNNPLISLQVIFALLLAAVVGSRMISTDLQEKSYNLYFARPLTKRDYLAGKFGIVSIILGLATVVPTLITFTFLLLLTSISSTYVVDHLWVWGAIIGQGLVVVLTFSTLSLAFSSLTARRFYAAAAMVVIYLVTTIIGQIVRGGFENKYGQLIGINENFDIIRRTAFSGGENIDWGFPWWYSLAALAAIWAACTFLVWYKIERTELSE